MTGPECRSERDSTELGPSHLRMTPERESDERRRKKGEGWRRSVIIKRYEEKGDEKIERERFTKKKISQRERRKEYRKKKRENQRDRERTREIE